MRSPSKLIFTCKKITGPQDFCEIHLILYLKALFLVPQIWTVFFPAGGTVLMYHVWHTLLFYKYQLLVMLMVMVWVSILKAKGQKWEENRNTSNGGGVVGEHESGRNSCWDRWIITHVSSFSSSCLWVLKGTKSATWKYPKAALTVSPSKHPDHLYSPLSFLVGIGRQILPHSVAFSNPTHMECGQGGDKG